MGCDGFKIKAKMKMSVKNKVTLLFYPSSGCSFTQVTLRAPIWEQLSDQVWDKIKSEISNPVFDQLGRVGNLVYSNLIIALRENDEQQRRYGIK